MSEPNKIDWEQVKSAEIKKLAKKLQDFIDEAKKYDEMLTYEEKQNR